MRPLSKMRRMLLPNKQCLWILKYLTTHVGNTSLGHIDVKNMQKRSQKIFLGHKCRLPLFSTLRFNEILGQVLKSDLSHNSDWNRSPLRSNTSVFGLQSRYHGIRFGGNMFLTATCDSRKNGTQFGTSKLIITFDNTLEIVFLAKYRWVRNNFVIDCITKFNNVNIDVVKCAMRLNYACP